MKKPMQFEIGKLYHCPKYYLLVYPSIKTASTPLGNDLEGDVAWGSDGKAMAWAAYYWSKELDCKVKYSNPNDIFMVLEIEKQGDKCYLHCLFPDFEGWIFNEDWFELKRVSQ